ncbi:hypothetical protein [Streptomyces sp. AS02]|uniref:hypothetical protein n=1 Tax=Streptomyces sp. AS02 TaxID=2938946 RepID=UPI00202193BE|nr:hypothetical protein [Streptomyces sp. AS02]MCL8014969.1 hypothetical protein [Streptomyces sp. AS02]
MTEQQHTVTAPAADIPPAPEADPAVPPVKKDRAVLRAVLRWTAAVAVFAAVGASTAYGITRMERTDVPGLATETDGRWAYPEITRPPLPSGSPAPFAEANAASLHHADLRELLLPAPEGATADKALSGRNGWLATKDFLAAYEPGEDRDTLAQLLTDHALRHIAARGWTMPDGTRTRIYLLRFGSGQVADVLQQDHLTNYDSPTYALRGAAQVHLDEDFPTDAEVVDVRHYAYAEAKPYGAEQVRQAYLVSGDVLGLVVQSREGGAEAVPFQQTVILQSQLLG